ncbi:hypothetical protein [Novosphingobium beihaiensis]|uniref:Uncharacterized protein n=1 Tax=Novosphingobium beihaiensis TaxID=2930389 RepID=A0ABT0BSL0_9SPHN|nr:hypothetical protein [Novosphingobium beihaiensis]MCJ2187771.1 hypothetical protein [Novosphingobium beihaiensis]
MTGPTETEIWFEQWLWSYMPCHWKGWAIVILHIAAVLTMVSLPNLAASHFRQGWIAHLAIIPLVAALFSLNRISKRHCRPSGG